MVALSGFCEDQKNEVEVEMGEDMIERIDTCFLNEI
jgi:hypothetical protein